MFSCFARELKKLEGECVSVPVLEASILKAFPGKVIWLRCTESPSPVSLSRTHRLSLPPCTQFSRYMTILHPMKSVCVPRSAGFDKRRLWLPFSRG